MKVKAASPVVGLSALVTVERLTVGDLTQSLTVCIAHVHYQVTPVGEVPAAQVAEKTLRRPCRLLHCPALRIGRMPASKLGDQTVGGEARSVMYQVVLPHVFSVAFRPSSRIAAVVAVKLQPTRLRISLRHGVSWTSAFDDRVLDVTHLLD